MLQTIKGRKANWLGHTLRRNCLLSFIAKKREGRISVTGRRSRRSKQLLGKEKRRHGKFNEEALARILCRTRC